MSSFDFESGYDIGDPKHPANANAHEGLDEVVLRPRSQSAYERREPGWYVVNLAGGTAVGGPFPTQLTATKLKAAVDERLPGMLVVKWLK